MTCAVQAPVPGVRDHKELEVWKLAAEVRHKVRAIADRPAFQRDFELRRQLTRAAESACANIAEGFARYYPREFARFLAIAKGSLTEVTEHLDAAASQRIVSISEAHDLVTLARRACGAATRLIVYLKGAKAP